MIALARTVSAGSTEGRGGDNSAPAVLLLGDAASADVIVAAHAAGRTFLPYAFAFDGSHPLKQQEFADQLGLHLKLINLRPAGVGADFIYLATQHRCRRPAEFELGFLVLHACEAVSESEVWLPLQKHSSAWPTVVRIARHYGKALFNPLAA